MTAAELFLAVSLVLVAVWSVATLPSLHPVQLSAIPWALAATLYALHLLPYRPLAWGTVAVAVLSTLAFAGGTMCFGSGRAVPGLGFAPPSTRDRRRAVAAATVLIGLTALLLGAYLAQAVSRYGLRATFVSTAALRAAVEHGDFAVTIKYIYVAMAAIAVSGVAAAVAAEARHRRAWLAITVVCVASLYFGTGRATIVSGAVVGLVAFGIAATKPIVMRRVLEFAGAMGLLALVVFLIGGQLIGKTFSNNRDLQILPSVFSQHRSLSMLALPYQYATAPIAALDVQVGVARALGDGHGCATFPAACSVLRKIGVHAPNVKKIRPFTAAPLPWNTYTALDVALIDGGRVLAVPIIGLLGVLAGLIWRWANLRRLLGQIAYALEAAALITAFGSFNFTAPDLLGAFLICAVTLWAIDRIPASGLGSASAHDPVGQTATARK